MSNDTSTRRRILGMAATVIGLTVLSQPVHAISRYTTTSMTCATIKATVRNDGAAILRWRSSRTGNLIYGRYVANRGYCSLNETTRVAYVPASNTKSCAVLKCVRDDRLFDDDDWFLFRRR